MYTRRNQWKKLIYWLKALKYTRGGVNPPTNRWVSCGMQANIRSFRIMWFLGQKFERCFPLQPEDRLHSSPIAMEMTPLRPPQWMVLRRKALAFSTLYPDLDVKKMTWPQRLTTPGMKETYALSTQVDHQQAIDSLGCAPCDMCGEWTASWCETCEGSGRIPLHPLCTACDKAHLVCEDCTKQKLIWKPARDINAEELC